MFRNPHLSLDNCNSSPQSFFTQKPANVNSLVSFPLLLRDGEWCPAAGFLLVPRGVLAALPPRTLPGEPTTAVHGPLPTSQVFTVGTPYQQHWPSLGPAAQVCSRCNSGQVSDLQLSEVNCHTT